MPNKVIWTKEQNEAAISKASEERAQLCRDLNKFDKRIGYYAELHRQQRQKISKKESYISLLKKQLQNEQ